MQQTKSVQALPSRSLIGTYTFLCERNAVVGSTGRSSSTEATRHDLKRHLRLCRELKPWRGLRPPPNTPPAFTRNGRNKRDNQHSRAATIPARCPNGQERQLKGRQGARGAMRTESCISRVTSSKAAKPRGAPRNLPNGCPDARSQGGNARFGLNTLEDGLSLCCCCCCCYSKLLGAATPQVTPPDDARGALLVAAPGNPLWAESSCAATERCRAASKRARLLRRLGPDKRPLRKARRVATVASAARSSAVAPSLPRVLWTTGRTVPTPAVVDLAVAAAGRIQPSV